jgi:hypothetical protein
VKVKLGEALIFVRWSHFTGIFARELVASRFCAENIGRLWGSPEYFSGGWLGLAT